MKKVKEVLLRTKYWPKQDFWSCQIIATFCDDNDDLLMSPGQQLVWGEGATEAEAKEEALAILKDSLAWLEALGQLK